MMHLGAGKLRKFLSTPNLLSILGLMIFLAQSIYFSLTQLPNLDEGSYLYKGYQFAIGSYEPFQPYGFWVNKMYLSFFIWGWIQQIFGAGLLFPRIFAVLFSTMAFVGVWIICRRLANTWIAALAVLAIALNPTLVSTYSIANSQVLVICMLTWVLVLTLGANRPLWQIITGSALAGVMVLTRENMIFFIPLLVLYVFWQHGWRKGLYSLGAAALVLVVGHILYWPEIMYLWKRWLPADLKGFSLAQLDLGDGSEGGNSKWIWQLFSLSNALSVFLVPILGTLIAILFANKKNHWQSRDHFRAFIFLVCSFLVLLASHTWASIGNEYCVYCTKNYYAFFDYLGIAVVASAFGSLNKSPAWISKAIALASIPVISANIFFSRFEEIGYQLIAAQVPRLREGKFLAGNVQLWQVLNNKFGLELEASRMMVPALTGFLVGVLFILIILLLFKFVGKNVNLKLVPFALYGFLVVTIVLSPLINWPDTTQLCSTNIPAAYEEVGMEINRMAKPGDEIYLDGRLATIPLLYVDDVIIHPPQVNDQYSFVSDADSNRVLESGRWNAELAQEWRESADLFIISEDRLQNWQKDGFFKENGLSGESYNILLQGCPVDSRLLVLERK